MIGGNLMQQETCTCLRYTPTPPTERVTDEYQDNVWLSTVAAHFLWESIFSLRLKVEPLDQEGRYPFLLQSDVALVSNLQWSPPITCFLGQNVSQLIQERWRISVRKWPHGTRAIGNNGR